MASWGREEALGRVRHELSRAFRPLLRRHDGWLFVYRRAILSRVEQGVRVVQIPDGYEVVSLDDAGALVEGARVHRPEPGLAVLEVPGGSIMGQRGHVGIDRTRVVAELGPGWPSDAQILREAAEAAEGSVVELTGTTANLAAEASQNYSHWLLQGCTRIALLELIGAMAACDHFLVSRNPPRFLLETLDRGGIEQSRVVVAADARTVYRCEHLLAPGMPRNEADTPCWALNRLRERFGGDPSPDATGRVYIGRGSAGRRMVLNENEVLELLVSRGFQAVTMDGRTVVEQAALLSRAECVVAPHGAALANLVFAPPGTTVVELTNNNWPHPVFRHIAATMGFRYVAIVGDEPRSPAWLGSPWIIDADNVVNIERLTRALDEAAVC